MFLGCRYLMFVDALVCVNVVLWLDKICVGHITLEWYFVLYSLWTEAYRFYLSITNERELFFFRDEDMTNILCPTSFFIRRPKSNLFLFYLTAKVMIAKIMMITLMIISQWYCLKYSYQNYYMSLKTVKATVPAAFSRFIFVHLTNKTSQKLKIFIKRYW